MNWEWMKKIQKPEHLLISLFRGIYLSSYIQMQYELIDPCSILSFGVPTISHPTQDCGLRGLGQRGAEVESMRDGTVCGSWTFFMKRKKRMGGWPAWYFFCQLGLSSPTWKRLAFVTQIRRHYCDLEGRPFLSSLVFVLLSVFTSLLLWFLLCYIGSN